MNFSVVVQAYFRKENPLAFFSITEDAEVFGRDNKSFLISAKRDKKLTTGFADCMVF